MGGQNENLGSALVSEASFIYWWRTSSPSERAGLFIQNLFLRMHTVLPLRCPSAEKVRRASNKPKIEGASLRNFRECHMRKFALKLVQETFKQWVTMQLNELFS